MKIWYFKISFFYVGKPLDQRLQNFAISKRFFSYMAILSILICMLSTEVISWFFTFLYRGLKNVFYALSRCQDVHTTH